MKGKFITPEGKKYPAELVEPTPDDMATLIIRDPRQNPQHRQEMVLWPTDQLAKVFVPNERQARTK
jgi:hypothetical protein